MKGIIALTLTIICSMLCSLAYGAVPLSKEFAALENLFHRGQLDELASQVYTAKAKTDEERALQTYLSAILKVSKNDTVTLLKQASDRFPGTYYGQVSLLERAKLLILERDIVNAKTLLSQITSPEISERYYWLAVCAESGDDHSSTIQNTEMYLRLEPTGKYAELSYYFLASAYKAQKKFQSGISTLAKLGSLPGLMQNEQYYYLLLGQLHQSAGNSPEALQAYRRGFELNRNSQLAFQIEDHLFEMKDRYGSGIDLGFLYPYAELAELTGYEPPETTQPVQITDTSPLKLNSKPKGGYFVQAGRFGSETNARNLVTAIRTYGLAANYYEDPGNKSTPWVVVSGPHSTKELAELTKQKLAENKINGFISYL